MVRLNADEFSPHHYILLKYILILSSLYAHPFCTVCILQLLYQNPQYKLLLFYPCHCPVHSCHRADGAVTGWCSGVGRLWGNGALGQWDSGVVGHWLHVQNT